MKKTIYNVAVLMESQAQCDRMKQLCIDNGLPIWKADYAFELLDENECFAFSKTSREFFIIEQSESYNYVTESEFIEHLKQEKA